MYASLSKFHDRISNEMLIFLRQIWNNTTEGGEDYDLYYLRDGLKNSVLPTAVCPYFKQGNEHVCPGLDAALEHNPVQFEVKVLQMPRQIL